MGWWQGEQRSGAGPGHGKREASLRPHPRLTSEDSIQPALPLGGSREGARSPRMGTEGLHWAREKGRPFWGRGVVGRRGSSWH